MSSEIDKYIQSKVKKILDENKFPDYDGIYSDTFSELIDKLIVVHIRLWYLEDAINIETDPIKIAVLKRKADVTFKEKRPMLVKSLDKMIFNLCSGKVKPIIENPKIYKGYQENNE